MDNVKRLENILKIVYIIMGILIMCNLVQFVFCYEGIAKTTLLVCYLIILFLHAVLYKVAPVISFTMIICILLTTAPRVPIDIVLTSLLVGVSLGISTLVVSIINSKSKLTLIFRIAILLAGIAFMIL